jgi:methionyl-tRNA formyltransferase
MPERRRLGICASGPVGRETLAFVLRQHPDDLQLIVVPNSSDLAALYSMALPARLGARCLTWEELNTVAGAARAREFDLDLMVLAWWPYIVRQPLLDLAKTVLNMHPSLLPYCRGKDPNFWALVEGAPFGVTIHHVDTSIDGGAIAFQREIPYSWEDTGETLYMRGREAMIALFKDVYETMIAGGIPEIPQNPAQGSFHKRAELDKQSRLHLDQKMTIRTLLNLLRARTFSEHPACRFEDDGNIYEVRIAVTKIGPSSGLGQQ